MIRLALALLMMGCASQPRITGIVIVGGSQMNNDNFFGNFYERDKTFNRVPGKSLEDLIRGTQQHLDGRQTPGIGIKIKGDFW